jgi:hypothetical protein
MLLQKTTRGWLHAPAKLSHPPLAGGCMYLQIGWLHGPAKNSLQLAAWSCKLADDAGRRYPDSWTYSECDRCAAREKRYLDGRVAVPTDEEWEQHCTR